MLDIEWFRAKVRASDYEVASHADEERQVEKVTMADLEEAVITGEIIEDYAARNDPRGHACLLSGKSRAGDPIHMVVAKTVSERMRICTVYRPTEDRFKDAKFRRPKS